MGQGKNILKNTLIYAIGNFGSRILAFLLLPLYSFYLTTDEFGTYDLFIVTINLLTPILSLQISDATYRWLIDVKGDIKKQSTIIFNGFILITVTSILFIIIYLISLNFIEIKHTGYFLLLLLSTLYLPFFQKVLRGLGKNLEYAISGIISTFIILILNILFLTKFNLKIESLFIASILSNVLVFLYITTKINLKTILRFINFDFLELKKMVKYSLPLVPNGLSWWLINASDKYIILYFLSIEANGVYAVSTRFPSIIMLLNSVFLMAWQDHGISANDSKEDLDFFSKLFNKFIILEMTSVIFLIAISPFLIKYLINERYIDSWHYLPLLFIGTAFNAFAAYIGVGYQRAKKTKGILKTSLIGGVVNISISLSLMRFIGLYAPALGTVISFLVVYLLRKHETNTFFKIKTNNHTLIGLVLISLIYTLLVQIDNSYSRFTLIFTALIIFFILNNKLLKDLIVIIKNNIRKTKKI